MPPSFEFLDCISWISYFTLCLVPHGLDDAVKLRLARSVDVWTWKSEMTDDADVIGKIELLVRKLHDSNFSFKPAERSEKAKRTPNGVSHPASLLTGASRCRKQRC